jgi:hypothetical protein
MQKIGRHEDGELETRVVIWGSEEKCEENIQGALHVISNTTRKRGQASKS